MIFFFPCRLVISQEPQEPLAAHSFASRLNNEGAAAAGTDEFVNFTDQFFREKYVCADYTHTVNVTYGRALVNAPILSKQKTGEDARRPTVIWLLMAS
jgi:hypothetical protein